MIGNRNINLLNLCVLKFEGKGECKEGNGRRRGDERKMGIRENNKTPYKLTITLSLSQFKEAYIN